MGDCEWHLQQNFLLHTYIIITHLCIPFSRPLCLNIAAQMICQAGDQWQEEVLPDLAASFMHGDGMQISVQDSIIVSSLNSISGTDSQQVKEMFMSTAIFAGACGLFPL